MSSVEKRNRLKRFQADLTALARWSEQVGLTPVIHAPTAHGSASRESSNGDRVTTEQLIDSAAAERWIPVVWGTQFGISVSRLSPLDRALQGRLVAVAGRSALSGAYGGISVRLWGSDIPPLARFKDGVAVESLPSEPSEARAWVAERQAQGLPALRLTQPERQRLRRLPSPPKVSDSRPVWRSVFSRSSIGLSIVAVRKDYDRDVTAKIRGMGAPDRTEFGMFSTFRQDVAALDGVVVLRREPSFGGLDGQWVVGTELLRLLCHLLNLRPPRTPDDSRTRSGDELLGDLQRQIQEDRQRLEARLAESIIVSTGQALADLARRCDGTATRARPF